MESNKVNVVIGDEIITLKSAENPEYLQRLARYVDDKMKSVLAKSVNASLDEKIRTLVIALNIADDYIKTADAYRNLDEAHTKFVLEAGRAKEENAKLKEELAHIRIELEERNKIEEAATEEEDLYENVLTMPIKQRKGRRNNAHVG